MAGRFVCFLFTLFRHGSSDAPGEMAYILINTATFPCEQLQLTFHTCHLKEILLTNKPTFYRTKTRFVLLSDKYKTINALKLIYSYYKRQVSVEDSDHHQATLKNNGQGKMMKTSVLYTTTLDRQLCKIRELLTF
jgi:hypothetical protein